ncbi:MAG: sigma 54-interacting transcriptional regulator [Deltaproteobacteria bacterium]|nr:sigma 54-interacting transcriptional regulator [Deltaproteobacteria bacterium]
MPALLALFGPKQGLRIPLTGCLVLGRAPTADLQLVDGKVSREHCRIDATGARAMLEDLGSHNGTYVNGEVIRKPTPLAEGDEIGLGDTLLLVAGDDVSVANARYGSGTLIVSPQGRATTAANPGPPLAVTPSKDGMRGLGVLAGRLAAAADEEEGATALLDAIEAELAPKRAMVLLRLWQGGDAPSKERVVALATRGKEAVVSTSRTLLERAATAQRGILVEDAFDSRELRGVRSVVLHSLRSVMVVPWGQREAAPRGFIHVDREPERPFGVVDLAWLEAVGHLATLRLAERPAAQSVVADEGPVGASPVFVAALGLATAAARVDSTVLLLGETGTGKEEIARLIHARSSRSRAPFVAVNCGAIAEAIAESELFGHEKGAFTGALSTRLGAFEAADGGTLFLDEIGDLSLPLQVKLLRVLQERAVVRVGASLARQVDVRILAATHRDLAADVQERLFREDLYFRLNVLCITLPPLRDRRDDIPLLARVLLDRVAARLGLRSPELGKEAEAALCTWEYPGNVRELCNVLERVLVLRDPRDPSPIDRDDVMAALGSALRPPCPPQASGEDRLADAVARVEKANIEAAMRRARGVKSHAARILGISRPTLDKKLAELKIDIWAKE